MSKVATERFKRIQRSRGQKGDEVNHPQLKQGTSCLDLVLFPSLGYSYSHQRSSNAE